MVTYWVMFLVPALAALASRPRQAVSLITKPSTALTSGMWLVMLALALLIGLRYRVGGDWNNYLGWMIELKDMELGEALSMHDPGYRLLNWVSLEFGLGIVGVNMFCGVLFAIGLTVFSASMPRPWLALAVAVPYLVIVVAMGYSRQGVALGFAMLGLVALGRGKTLRFVIWIILGATFHKSAVILLPIAALAATGSRYWKIFWVMIVTVGAYYLLLEDSVDRLVEGYIEAEYQSEGALIRVLMISLSAVIFFRWRKRFALTVAQYKLWTWISIISLMLLVMVFVASSTTAIDRIGLYMLPLQLLVFSHLPDAIGRPGKQNSAIVAGILCFYTLVLFVWLNFSGHAFAWLPYRIYPLPIF